MINTVSYSYLYDFWKPGGFCGTLMGAGIGVVGAVEGVAVETILGSDRSLLGPT